MRKKLLLIGSFALLILGGIANTVFSQNLLVNGDFEGADLTPWNNLVGGNGVATYSLETTNSPEGQNHMKVDITTAGSSNWSIQSFTSEFNVIKDSTYTISWLAKSSVAGVKMKAIFQLPSGQMYSPDKELTTDWQTYSVSWKSDTTAQSVEDYGYMKIWWMGVAEFYIDSVVVEDPTYIPPPSSQNLLANWGFEEELTAEGSIPGWINLVGDDGVATYSRETTGSPEGNNHMKVDVQTLGANGWSLQSFSPTFNAIKDSTYQVAWLARSSVEGAEMNVIFQDQAGQQYGGKKALTTEWAVYKKKWTAAASGEAYLKMWWMNVGEYEIDSVVVEDPTYVPGLEPQSIDFPAIVNKFTTDAPFDITATASSGLPVTLSLTSGPATLDGNTVYLTGDPGTVTIKASQTGDDTYNPATEIERSFAVTPEDWVYEQTLEYDVKFTPDLMTIDGKADEESWGSAPMDTAKMYYNDPNNDPNYFTEDITPADLSATFKVLWSESGIYVYADITDDVIHTDSLDIHTNGKAYTYDNLEVYFHVPEADWAEDLKASGDYVMTTFQMRSNIDAGDYWSGRDGTGYTTSRLDNFYTYAFASKEGGVTFEGFYPFEKLFGGSTASLPSRFGETRSILFEFAYNDSDGEGTGGVRSGGILWNSIPDVLNSYSDVAYNDRMQFGMINLSTQLTQTINFNALSNMTYGESDFDPEATATSGLSVTYSSSEPDIASIVNGKIHIVSPGTVTIYADQAGDDTYAAVQESQVLTILPKELTVTGASAESKVYDGTTDAIISGATLIGVLTGEDVTLANEATGTFDTKNAGTGINVTTAMDITGADIANYTLIQPALNADITAKELTVTGASAESKVYDGTTDAIISGATLIGVLTGEDVTLANEATGTFDTKNAGTGINVTTAMEITGADIANYTLIQPALNADITAKELTVTGASAESKVYDGTTDAIISGATLIGVLTGEDVTLANEATGTFDTKNVGTGINVTTAMDITGADIANYSLTQPALNADITAKELTVTADAKEKVEGENDPVFTYTITNGNLISGESLTGELSREAGETAGTYAIQQGTLTAGSNYTITFVSADLTILEATSVSSQNMIDLKIYPNPTNGIIRIETSIQEIQKLIIMGVSGKQVYVSSNAMFSDPIDLSYINSGVYYLIIYTDKQTIARMIIKK